MKSQNGEDAILLSGSFSCVIQSEAKNPGSFLASPSIPSLRFIYAMWMGAQ
jgi:hypothetical protein